MPTVSWVPGNSVSALIGALSFAALEMKSIGSSGGGAEVGANDGRDAVPEGAGPDRGRRNGRPGRRRLRFDPCGRPRYLAAGVRDSAVHVVRPHGLTLEEVGYPADELLAERNRQARNKRTLPGAGCC
ncbi:hypothetical protein GCM10022206_03670 [Streptomyces chiangmaiensis]